MIMPSTMQPDLKSLIIKTPTVTKETTIKDFITLMEKHKTDLMPVVDNNMVVGVVSENDLIKLVKAQPIAGMQAVIVSNIPKNLEGRTVGEIMTKHPITINIKSTIIETIKAMTASNLKRIIAVDDSKKLLGIIRIKDLWAIL